MEYKKIQLKELIDYANTGADAIQRAPIVEYDTGVRCIRIGDISNNRKYEEWGFTEISKENYNKYKLDVGDILIARTGSTIGICKIIKKEINGVYNNGLIKVKVNKDKCDSNYFYYILQSKDFINYIQGIAFGTTGQPNMKINDFLKFEINDISIEKQNKIANILLKIDEKIDLNNQINDNLLKFGLGLITEEMKKQSTKELRNIIKFIKGKKPINISEIKKDKYLSYLTIANLNNQENLYASTENVIIADNDLLMVMDGASSGDVYYSDYGIVGSTLAKIDIIDTSYNQASIYFILKYFSEYIKSKNTGSAIPHTDKEIVYKLVIPDIDNQKKYENILKNILQLNKQNKILEQLRDTLLPKLMNGEIDLDKIEI